MKAGDMLRHHDIKTDKTNGCCRLYLRTDRAYYVSLGLKQGKAFILSWFPIQLYRLPCIKAGIKTVS
jgi:hypothetical protein